MPHAPSSANTYLNLLSTVGREGITANTNTSNGVIHIISTMKFGAQKMVAVVIILSLNVISTIISVTEDGDGSSSSLLRNRNVEAPHQEVSLARRRRDEKMKYHSFLREKNMRRRAETLKLLDETEDIWFRRSPEQHAQLIEMHETRKLYANNTQQFKNIERLSICGRETKAGTPKDLTLFHHFQNQDNSCPGTSSNNLLLISGREAYGRTGNNIIEFLHALQFARDNDATLGIILSSKTWVFMVILEMWMSKQDDDWEEHFEEAFCVKIFHSENEVKGYNVIRVPTKELYLYRSSSPFEHYIGHQAQHLQTLFRHYNNGEGRMISGIPVKDMCSGLNAVFGKYYKDTIYSVIHQRALEGGGAHALYRMSKKTGCSPTGALNMEPDYIKSILAPLGMLHYPIVLIRDGEDPSVLERLQADPDISKMLRVIGNKSSWTGGDITLAVMSNVFIGNPASSFSAIIAKSRLALGFGHNYLYRAKDQSGKWSTVCGDTCIYDSQIIGAIA